MLYELPLLLQEVQSILISRISVPAGTLHVTCVVVVQFIALSAKSVRSFLLIMYRELILMALVGQC